MWYVVMVLSLVCIGFFMWANREDRRRKKKQDKRGEKPLFRSEDDLEEYAKSMDPHPVDFDDAE